MPLRIEPALLRQMTVQRLLKVLQFDGPLSRADLTRKTGISAPTVSKAVAPLIESGLLEESEPETVSAGRPGRLLRLATERAQILGIVLDRNECEVAAAGLDGALIERRNAKFATPATYDGIISAVAEHATRIINTPSVVTLGACVSTPGLIDHRLGRVELSPNLPVTNQQTPAADLAARLDLDCLILQETHGLCRAEQLHGRNEAENFVVLDISTGMGLGVVAAGDVLYGRNGMAGELGHLTIEPGGRLCGCGNRGCLETVATDSALADIISQRVGRKLEIADVIAQVRSGELEADEELKRIIDYVAVAVAGAVNLFNPEKVFIYGQLFDVRDDLFEQMVDIARQRSVAPSITGCDIVLAKTNKIRGAVAGAIYQLTRAIGPAIS